MRTLFLIILSICFTALNGYTQDIFGKNRQNVAVYMLQNFREYRMRNPVNVDELNFYKFEHVSGEKTLIAVFGDDGLCESFQVVIDSELLGETVTELNKTCKIIDKNKWVCNEFGNNLNVILTESDWFFTVSKALINGKK